MGVGGGEVVVVGGLGRLGCDVLFCGLVRVLDWVGLERVGWIHAVDAWLCVSCFRCVRRMFSIIFYQHCMYLVVTKLWFATWFSEETYLM